MYNCETFQNFYVPRTRELSLATTLAKNMVEISTMRLQHNNWYDNKLCSRNKQQFVIAAAAQIAV